MGNAINLLQQEKNYKKIEKILHSIRIAIMVFGIATLITLFVILFLKRNITESLDAKNQRKAELLTGLNRIQDIEAKILLLNQKSILLERVLSTEPPYLQYYQTLTKHLPQASASGKMLGITIDKELTAKVQLEFPDIISLSSFLSHLETQQFKDDFATAQVSGVEYTEASPDKLKLNLDVKFKK